MRVVFLSWRELAHPQAGGSEIVVDRLATELCALGHEVALVCGGPVGNREYRVLDAGGRFAQYVKTPVLFWRHFREWDLTIDVSNGIPFFAPLWQRGPVVCWVHHVHREQWAQHFPPPIARIGWFLERSVVPRLYSRGFFAGESASTGTALEHLGIAPESIRIVPLGIDRPERQWSRSPEPLFVTVGRLVPHKRIDLLLRAWERVEPVVGGRLVIVGDGPERERQQRQAGATVEFTGPLPETEKQRLLAEAWLLVHSAQHEGWGMVIMEAAASGTPALAFDVSGVRDSVVDGETGVLVPDEEAFISTWIALAQDADLRSKLGAAARARAAVFSWAEAGRRVEQIAAEAVERWHSERGNRATA